MWNKIGKGASKRGVSREFLLKGKDQYSWPPCTKFYSLHFFFLFWYCTIMLDIMSYHIRMLPWKKYPNYSFPFVPFLSGYALIITKWMKKCDTTSLNCIHSIFLVSYHQCWVSTHYHTRINHKKSDTTTSNFIQHLSFSFDIILLVWHCP